MSLDVARLAQKIFDLSDDYDTTTPAGKAAARQDFANKLAQAIVEEIKQVKINYTNGLAAGATAVGGTFNHTVS